jgi:maltose/maltodextrin transport system substrate-binding protein
MLAVALLGLTGSAWAAESRLETEGLVGHWKLDEGFGTAINDSSGSGNHGTLTGGSWVTGKVGSHAVAFDGSNGKIEIPHHSSIKPANAITVAVWVKSNQPSWNNTCVLFTKSNSGGGAISLYAERAVVTCYLTTTGGTGGPSTGAFEPVGDIKEWHHYALTFDGKIIKAYSDGSLKDTRNLSHAGTIAYDVKNLPLYIGVLESKAIDGALDDIRIYNRALSESEIATLAALGGQSELAQADQKSPEFKRTGWNAMVRQRFTHPPVFQYAPAEGATRYRFSAHWTGKPGTKSLESAKPQIDLARIWDRLPPAGPFAVMAEALDDNGQVLGTRVSSCQRIAAFKGPYRPAQRDYGESGAKAVGWMLKKKPDAEAYPYGILMYSSYINLLTSFVKSNPKAGVANQAAELAVKYGQDMLETSTPGDWAYANVPRSHKGAVFQVCRAGMAGVAYLELYEITKDEQWLAAAIRIGETLQKMQRPKGRWPWRVEPQTGKILADYTSDQAEAILLLDELIGKHNGKDLEPVRDKAVRWMLENPCKTFIWQNQYEDTNYDAPYTNLEWFDTALMIEYLLRHATEKNEYEKIATELSHYIEDQFVEWEPCGNEITPGVREQYCCYWIIDAHYAFYIRMCMAFHAKTKDEVWLKKARALADTLTAAQHPDGFYPTWMRHKPSKENPQELKDINYQDVWPNCTAFSGAMLIRLGEYIKAIAATKSTNSGQ